MTTTITRTDLAELFDAVGKPAAAAYQREQAAADQAEEAQWRDNRLAKLEGTADYLLEFLENEAPQPSKQGTHDADCWKKHPGCFTGKVRQITEGGA